MRAAVALAMAVAGAARLLALGDPAAVAFAPGPGWAPLVESGRASPVLVDGHDWPGVRRAAQDFCADTARVAGVAPVLGAAPRPAGCVVIAGTLGRSALIDALVRAGKLDVGPIAGKWEACLVQGVEAPFPGVARAVVIAGSDKRGTIYGLYGLSEQIGVSPWYAWADVPPQRHAALYLSLARRIDAGPAVRYRGIFLNDEAPALAGWAREKYGGFNHRFYASVYELLLRLGANTLWPAMWENCFAEDDPANPAVADDYGIVMGTSHVEPMMRADKEWDRAGFTAAQWNYETHGAALRAFWDQGIARTAREESIITIGMRGKVDTPMSPTANIALLERIVADQRAIIARHPGPGGAAAPQVWALYKEVQEYYELGMRVPDDVTLLWCDDNWGNLRRAPAAAERARRGGAGVYYHFDYVGGPRSYKWLNTYPITKVWEQMHLAWRYGADRLWIVNVGDLKPMEFPMEFFLAYARHPERWPHERLDEFGRAWAAREFGPDHAAEIAALIAGYTKFNGRRKPELLGPGTYSLIDYDEAEGVAGAYADLAVRADRLAAELPPEDQAAFFQLVGYPVKACAAVNELYLAVAQNRLWAAQGRASAAAAANRARFWFKVDAELAERYNRLENGRWDHMMDQSHIGYTGWRDPPANILPALAPEPPAQAGIAVAVEGATSAWTVRRSAARNPALPVFDRHGPDEHWLEVFRRSGRPSSFTATPSAPWIKLSRLGATLGPDVRIKVSIDWSRLPAPDAVGAVTIQETQGGSLAVAVHAEAPPLPGGGGARCFLEAGGYISIEAAHFAAAVAPAPFHWDELTDFGRTLSGVALYPVTGTPPASARLEYRTYFFQPGPVVVDAIVAPTLAFLPGRPLRCALAFDDDPPQIVDLALTVNSSRWNRAVSDGVNHARIHCRLTRGGPHTLKWWILDPAIVLEKIVIDAGGLRPSYLGPPESYCGP